MIKQRQYDVSIIICHHVGDLIFKLIESIRNSNGVTYEIIVITSDETLATTGIKGCRVMHSNSGPAEKRNIGYRLSYSDILVFLDDDVEINSDCLKILVDSIKSGIGMVYGKLYNMEFRDRLDEAGSYLTPTGFLWSRAAQNIVDTGQFNKKENILSGKSALCAISADLFHRAGGFDEDFFILGEETDLAWRVWLVGRNVVFNPYAIGYHAFNTKFKPVKKHYTSSRVHYNGCRNYITMLIKNLERPNLLRILPIHMAIWFCAGVGMCLTLKFKQGFNIFRGLFYVARSWSTIMRKRDGIQRKRVRSDRDLWPYIYRKPPRGYYSQRFLKYIRIGLHG